MLQHKNFNTNTKIKHEKNKSRHKYLLFFRRVRFEPQKYNLLHSKKGKKIFIQLKKCYNILE